MSSYQYHRSIHTLLLLIITTYSHGSVSATYYVDVEQGNDSFTGTASTPSGTTGPWKTLSRVKSAALSAGDEILLKCGQKWAETLSLGQSGTPTAPIKISSNPVACENKPTIDGSIQIPATAWQSSANGNYITSYPFSLIPNGDFSAGMGGWSVWSENKSATLSVGTTNCKTGSGPCLQLNASTNIGHGLASSPAFRIESSREYTANISARIPTGKWIRLTLRRNSAPWDSIAQTDSIGNGEWKDLTLKTTPRSAIGNLRLDIEFSGSITAQLDDIRLTPTITTPKALYNNGKWQNIAHHPNRGSITTRLDSQYFLTAEASNRVLRNDGKSYGSTYVVLDALNDGLTSAGVAGDARLFMRTTPWQIEEFSVIRIEGNRAYLDRISAYPIEKGMGYFFTGSPWMLDREEEWLYNGTAKSITYRPADSALPMNVTVSELATGVDLTNRANITLENIRISNVEIAVAATNSAGIRIYNTTIENTSREGILISGSRAIEIHANEIRNTGRDAISGYRTTASETTYAHIHGNVIDGSGLHFYNGKIVSTPAPSMAAIYSAAYSTVENNQISHTAYNGIYPGPNSRITGNIIRNSCELLDDCAGIYLFGSNHYTTIERNLVENLVGTIDGITRTRPHAVGIYLDELSSDVSVKRNTVINAAYGIQLHNAFRNIISENTLFGNRIYQMWLQEGSRIIDSAGDLHSNDITGNKIFSTSGTYGVALDTSFSTTARFANYDYNLHSGLINPYIAREGVNAKETAYTFAAWQAITARQSDPNGTEVKPTGYASFYVANYGIFAPRSDSTFGWTSWSSVQPRPAVAVESYSGELGVSLQANTAPSLLSSPNFSVKKGSWYRVTFDVASSQAIRFEAAGRRGGGGTNGYEFLSDNSTRVFSDNAWKRFSFTFRSNASVIKDDPVTLDNGARIDFQNVPSGTKLLVKNLEVVEVSPVGTSLVTAILSNDTYEPKVFECPDEGITANACNYFVNFDGTEAIAWPYTVQPLEAVIVYTKDTSLQDIDGDGIADIQDACPDSPAGEFVNARGCGRLQ